MKRNDSINSKSSGKTVPSSTTKTTKRSYRHLEMIQLNQIKSIYDFVNGVENGVDNCLTILRDIMSQRLFSIEQYHFQLGTKREEFIKLMIQHYWPLRVDADVHRDRPISELKSFSFLDCERLASTMSKSRFGHAKAKITRTFSMSRRGSTAVLLPSAPNVAAQSVTPHGPNLPRVPTTRKLNRLSTFMSPLTNLASPMSRKQSVSNVCLNNLTVSSIIKYPSMHSLQMTPTNS